MKLFSSTLLLSVTAALAGSTPQGAEPSDPPREARAGPFVLEIRCGDDPAKWGEVHLEGADGRQITAPISQDGLACAWELAPGWARVRSVQAGPGASSNDATVWCLDPPLHFNPSGGSVTLNLSPGFTITGSPRLAFAYSSGTATLVREAGAEGAYVAGQCDVAEVLGSIYLRGLRQGKYRLVLPWRNHSYVSSTDLHLSGIPRLIEDTQFDTRETRDTDAEWRLAAVQSQLGAPVLKVNVRGTVRSGANAPVPYGKVILVRSDLPGPWVLDRANALAFGDAVEALCDGGGTFEIRGLRAGTYLVAARPAPMKSESSIGSLLPLVFESIQFDGGVQGGEGIRTVEAAIVVAPARPLRCRVVTDTGAPIPHATVMLVRSNVSTPQVLDPRSASALGMAVEAHCDADGKFEVQGVPQGSYLVGAWPPQAQPAGSNSSLPPIIFRPTRFSRDGLAGDGLEPLRAEFVAVQGAVLRGRVLGDLPWGVRVAASWREGAWETEAPVAADGSFTFGEVPHGEYWIDIRSERGAPQLCLEKPLAAVAGGDPTELVPRPATRLSVVASFPKGYSSMGTVQIAGDSVVPGTDAPRWLPAPRRVTWERIGTAIFEGVPPGRYRVTFREDPWQSGRGPLRFAAGWVEVPPESPRDATVQLKSASCRSFTVFNDDSERSISVEFGDQEGPLFSVEVPRTSSQSITIPVQATGADAALAEPLRAVIRPQYGAEPVTLPVGNRVTSLRYPGRN